MFVTILLTSMFTSTALVLAACMGASRSSRLEEEAMVANHQFVSGD